MNLLLEAWGPLGRFLEAGGVFSYLVVGCSVVAVAIILEKAFSLRRGQVVPSEVAQAISELGSARTLGALEELCAREKSVLERLVLASLRNLALSKFENAEALQTKARAEIARLERGLVVLEIIVGIGPLLGLLGTISGLITIFGQVGEQGLSSQGGMIARGISEALHTTLLGLGVSVPCLVAHSIYSRRVELYSVELEDLCLELLAKLYGEGAVARF
ncbi:MotA/TolQ/ExbB proton channel family protein [Candidatus Methylacidithermus pantelleriae]|uniref:MotA/TolQ/ExbB proton channel family protein n=1 Tax=Candidatus Methylacidithermus pantelleriae TaxID=2744239 RepID=A0A8J2BUC6_9BACT|nr:MotA/TolQ/ExbB proton channel family protein [Candidatus Methylacidithermus pantelleriae]CAF0701053.1 MotA/TolQ/ExbB proton channel family protein [Candidatus Methylacidithermus pantelleriae]